MADCTENSIPFTEENYTALTDAIAQGAQRVQYGNKLVEYRSLDDMMKILGLMQRALGKCAANGRGRVYAQYTSGR